tara:strand:- start:567 stop:791 length:225 start_codon:yes stop_codon:yes gene_type:complete
MMEKIQAEYYGKLNHQQIEIIQDILNKMYDNAPCHMNATIRTDINKALDTFIEPETIDKPNLKNRFIETIKIQY